VLVTLSATACTATPTTDASPTSTFVVGSPWLGAFKAVTLPTPVNSLRDVDCATAELCWAVGSTAGVSGAPNGAALIATTDGGATWTGQPIPPTVGYLSAIACSDRHHCTAVGQTTSGQAAVITTTTGGAIWTQQAAPAGVLDITTVSCETDRRCLAVGSTAGGVVALVSVTPGSAWTAAGSLPATVSGATGVSCIGDQQCWVTVHTSVDADHVAGAVALTSDGGTTWTVVPTPTGIGYLNAVSCLPGSGGGSGAAPFTSSTGDVASPSPVTSGTAATTPSATTPPVTTAPIAPTTTAPVVGAAGVRCTVVGTTAATLDGARSGRGVLLTTDNGGATWTRPVVPATTAALTGVSCTAVGTCIAVGSAVALVAEGGVVLVSGAPARPWARAAAVGVPQPLTAVSCTSTTSCVAVGESISEHLVGG
jgi:hypothetical protein